MNTVCEVNDLIAVDGARGFNHGCRDYAILRVLEPVSTDDPEDCIVMVEEVSHCHGCWQVGHDQGHLFMGIREIGDVFPIEQDRIQDVRSNDWAADVQWEYV